VLMALYSIRSERAFCERLNYDMLFKLKRPGICSGSDSTERWRDASTKEVSPGVEGAGDPARS
jgi:hypothetical protein